MTIANSIILADNAYGTLASGLAIGDTSLSFTSGHGARFPAVAAGQALNCCILNSSNVLEEIIITLHTAGSDTATITRAANGTSAKAWNSGDRIEARISSEVLKKLQQEAFKEVQLTTTDTGITYTGLLSPPHLGYVSGMLYSLTQTATNQAAATVNLNALGAAAVKLDEGTPIPAGIMPAKGVYQFDGTNLVLTNPLPCVKAGAFNLDLSAGTTTITGVGFKAREIEMTGAPIGGSRMALGWSAGTNSSFAIYDNFNASPDTWGMASAGTAVLFFEGGGGTNTVVRVDSIGTDGFTLARTVSGSPSGTAVCIYRARR